MKHVSFHGPASVVNRDKSYRIASRSRAPPFSLVRIRVAARRMRALDPLPPFPFSGSAARMNESRGERPPGMSPIPRVTLPPFLLPFLLLLLLLCVWLKIAGSTDVIDLSSPDQNGEPVRNIRNNGSKCKILSVQPHEVSKVGYVYIGRFSAMKGNRMRLLERSRYYREEFYSSELLQ